MAPDLIEQMAQALHEHDNPEDAPAPSAPALPR